MVSVSLKTTWRSWPIQSWVALLLGITLFTLPLSSTAKSVSVVITLCAIVFSPEYRLTLLKMITKPWCQAAFALFFIVLLGSIWSPADSHEKLMAIEKYSKLLYLPILVAAFTDPRARDFGLHGFLLAMVVTCFVSILWFYGYLSLSEVEGGGVFRNRIMTGFMMAFAAYLSSFLFTQQIGKNKLIYAFLTLLFTYHVFFINEGRTGYVVYFILMVLLMLQTFSWRQAIVGIVLGCSLFGFIYYQSPVMQGAIHDAMDDCRRYSQNEKDTHIGFRLQFHDYAYTLFKRSPWFGNGTASFTHTFHLENPIPGRGDKLLEPHSQYWLIASEFGLLGCFAFLFFVGSLMVTSLRLKILKPLAFGVLLPFIAGCWSDSLLFYSGTGYFFILFMALCLGEQDDV